MVKLALQLVRVLKSQVSSSSTPNSPFLPWANAGVVLGARMHRER